MNVQHVLGQIESLSDECGDRDWDGYEADPVSRASMNVTRRLVEGFLADVVDPDVCALPEGDVCLDWWFEGGDSAILSVHEEGVSYAMHIGEERIRGTERAPYKQLVRNLLRLTRKHS